MWVAPTVDAPIIGRMIPSSQNFFRGVNMQKYMLVLILIVMTLAPDHAMANSVQEKNQSIIVRTVIRDIISTLPSSTDRICVVEIDLSNEKSRERIPLNLHDIDSRIVMDKSMCDPQAADHRGSETIMYFSNMGSIIGKMSRPADRKGQKALDRALEYVKAGTMLVGVAVDKCGSDVHIYAFGSGENSSKLIEALVLAPLECSTELKRSSLSGTR